MSLLLSLGGGPANAGSTPPISVKPGIASAAAPTAVDLKNKRRLSVAPVIAVFMIFSDQMVVGAVDARCAKELQKC
jgi:hypothetical protein